MAMRTGGLRRKTRHIMRKNIRDKGKISIRRSLQELYKGDKVTLLAEPAKQNGLYHRRFHGMIGTVNSKKGECYDVSIIDGKTEKHVLVHPVHLKKR